jgi:hypothetical protein
MENWKNNAAALTTPLNNKETLKLKFACLYNLAVYQYYWEQFDTCQNTCASTEKFTYINMPYQK